MTNESIKMEWKPPQNDGFSMIERYEIHVQVGEQCREWKIIDRIRMSVMG